MRVLGWYVQWFQGSDRRVNSVDLCASLPARVDTGPPASVPTQERLNAAWQIRLADIMATRPKALGPRGW